MEQELIDSIQECEQKSIDTKEVHLVFPSSRQLDNTEDKYIVYDISHSRKFKSRHSIYDSQFKEISLHKKREIIYRMLDILGFKKSIVESLDDLIAQEGMSKDVGRYQTKNIENLEEIFTKEIILNDNVEILTLILSNNLNISLNILTKDDMEYVRGLVNDIERKIRKKTIYTGFCSFKDLYLSLNEFISEYINSDLVDTSTYDLVHTLREISIEKLLS